jgi:hypothetical protein
MASAFTDASLSILANGPVFGLYRQLACGTARGRARDLSRRERSE